MMDDSCNGIFALLSNESKLPLQSTRNFIMNVHETWKDGLVAQKSIAEEGFTIRHFAGDVFYNAVNFVNDTFEFF